MDHLKLLSCCHLQWQRPQISSSVPVIETAGQTAAECVGPSLYVAETENHFSFPVPPDPAFPTGEF